jgi:hypothetical protein
VPIALTESAGAFPVLPIVLALGAAACFGVSATVEQRAAARTRSTGAAVQAGLLLRLVRQPLWLAGFGVALGHFALQASALGLGRLVLVSPLLSCGLLFALPLSVRVDRHRMSAADVLAALAVAGGVGLFLALARPTGGRLTVDAGQLAAASAAAVVIAAMVIPFAVRARPARRGLLLGIAAGVCFGTLDAIVKTVARLAGTDILGVLTDPRIALLAIVGIGGFTIQQNGYRAAGLSACLPAIATVPPVVGALLGVLVYGEQVHSGVGTLAGESIAGVIAVCGIAWLAHSTLATYQLDRGEADGTGLVSRQHQPLRHRVDSVVAGTAPGAGRRAERRAGRAR